MRLRFIGSGSAFTTVSGTFQSNMLFETNDPETGEVRRLLLDCGTDVRWGLHSLGLEAKDIDAVYVSHLHMDHAGGMEWLGFANYFCHEGRRIPLYLAEPLAVPLWDNYMKGSMELLDFGLAELETFFDVQKVETDESFVWMGARFHIAPMVHLRGGGYMMWSYGLFVETESGGVLVTTDTRFELDRLQPWYDKATHLIFHDCETNSKCSATHAHFDDLAGLPEDIKARTWLYHINAPNAPDAHDAGFRGIVTSGQVFDLGRPILE